MILGGVVVQQGRHFVGHSDADVLLHAITDALLSGSSLPDIGQLFPNDREENRGRDSGEMLSLAMAKVRQVGWDIVNLDCVILLENGNDPKDSSDTGGGRFPCESKRKDRRGSW
jgi:2-C-methyl-D-erythritol 2,4-cyclodiphosphate synthase